VKGQRPDGSALRRAADTCERWTGIPTTGVVPVRSAGTAVDWVPVPNLLKEDLARWRDAAAAFGRGR
jgi:hypothetical protein